MTCDNQVGVKNILLSFHDCDTDAVYGPIAHVLASDTLPTWRLCPYKNEPLPHGYVTRKPSNPEVEISVIRDLRIPLSMYQGCSDVTLQVEYFNGLGVLGHQGYRNRRGEIRHPRDQADDLVHGDRRDAAAGSLESTTNEIAPTFAMAA